MVKPNYSNRISSLDIMRGIAIVLMITAHINESGFLGFGIISGVLAVPFFLIVAGTGYQLFIHSRMKRYTKKFFVFMETFWRAVILFLVTTGLFLIGSILFPIFEYDGIIKWNVFQVIAVGYIFGFFISNSIKTKIISIIAIFIFSFLINNFQIEALYYFSKGLFPLIPYLSYFIFGQILYELYKKKNFSLKRNRDLINYGTIFLLLNLFIFYLFPYQFASSNRDYFPEFLMISSIFLLFIVVIIRWVDLKNRFKKLFVPFENIGKIAFTAYYLQMILIVVFYTTILGTSSFIDNLIILIISIFALASFEKIWRRYDYILGLEWILRKGTSIMMKKMKYQ